MVKSTSSLALTALGVSTAVLSVAATSCLHAVTVTTTLTAAAAATPRPLSCFPTELDCAVLVSYCAASPSVSASSSVRGPPGSRPPPAETSPYGRNPSEHGGETTAPGQVTRLVPVPESTAGAPFPVSSASVRPVPVSSTSVGPVPVSSASVGPVPVPSASVGPVPVSSASVHPALGPSSGSSQAPPWQHHTYERANCSSPACTGTPTPSAPRHGSSSTTRSEALLTAVSSAAGFVSASSNAVSDGTSADTTATAPTSGRVPTAWPEHHAPSSWGTGTRPYVSWHRTDSPGGYDFSFPAPPSVSSGTAPVSSGTSPVSSGTAPVSSGTAPVSSGTAPVSSGTAVYPTTTSFSESVDAATGSVSTSSDTPDSTGTTLLTTRKSSDNSHFSATSPVTEPTRASYKTSSSHVSSREAPSYAQPPSYRARVRPFKR
ncbi:hypothetical protein G6O67_005041 [Ophiocordyceps sinensis]|uniref:Uncharacterized protein n=1 Tax=Ophiocordyceps sinensis TaxID=72228 RepID=A0A8H4PQT7_9HYPO|nr:hypothetical protein G6O67_005041 [Ophiocordyceps sinensis]